MLKDFFKKTKYVKMDVTSIKQAHVQQEAKPTIPTGLWVKCEACGQTLYSKDLEKCYKTCTYCGAHSRVSAPERLEMILDEGSFVELYGSLKSSNPLGYPSYDKKIQALQEKTGLSEAIVTGRGKIKDQDTMIGVMDSRFMMGSMGSVVGEKITRLIETATENRLPVVVFTASGGARMQEGIFSLMQMAKISAALSRHNEAGLVYIVVLTDPTTGGVTASFAMLGDVILAEPGALIGFAGPRVIEQTIKQKLPEGFQRAEFLLQHGFVDKIVPRNQMRETLGLLLSHYKEGI